MDTRFLSQMMQSRDSVWGKFALDSVFKEEIPDGFPLKHAFTSWFPDQLFLADRPRWKSQSNTKPVLKAGFVLE